MFTVIRLNVGVTLVHLITCITRTSCHIHLKKYILKIDYLLSNSYSKIFPDGYITVFGFCLYYHNLLSISRPRSSANEKGLL